MFCCGLQQRNVRTASDPGRAARTPNLCLCNSSSVTCLEIATYRSTLGKWLLRYDVCLLHGGHRLLCAAASGKLTHNMTWLATLQGCKRALIIVDVQVRVPRVPRVAVYRMKCDVPSVIPAPTSSLTTCRTTSAPEDPWRYQTVMPWFRKSTACGQPARGT